MKLSRISCGTRAHSVPVTLTLLVLLMSARIAQAQTPRWGRFETTITNTRTYADPYKDVTLNVTYTNPNGVVINFWGFYDGGQTWKIRYMPDVVGTWQYNAQFSDGQPGRSGSFTCSSSTLPGTISKYGPNPRWFGYRGGNAVLIRSFQAQQLFSFSFDDPSNPNDGEKRKLFLDWAQGQGYNTFSAKTHFSATDATGPGAALWPLDYTQYRKVEMVLNDLSNRRVMIHGFAGFFGRGRPYPTDAAGQSLYIRYCLARFAPYWNEIFSVAGPEPNTDNYLTPTDIRRLGSEIANGDPFDHLLGVHNKDGNDPYIGDAWSSFATLQHEITDLTSLHTYITGNYNGKPIYGHEMCWLGNTLQPAWTTTDLRKHMWIHMMAGASFNVGDMNGNSSSGFSGSCILADKVQVRHDIPKKIWDFMATTPFFAMSPAQNLRNNGFMLAEIGYTYLCYLPAGGTVNIAVAPGTYTVKWINPSNPMGDQRSAGTTTTGANLSSPDTNDWLVYLQRTGLIFSDGFENGLGNWVPAGSPATSSVQKHAGSFSCLVNSSGVQFLSRTFSVSYSKVCRFWFWDNASDTSLNVLARADDGTNWRAIGVNSATSNTHYVFRVGNTFTASSKPRATGWHEFKLDYTSGSSVTMSIDGTVIASGVTGLGSFNRIQFGDWWGDNNNGAVYLDDISVQ